MAELEQRARVIAEARTWLRTPYHHQGRIKGVGVDCLMLLCEIYHAVGLVPFVDPGPYPRDWHLHRNEERYANGLFQYARQVDVALPGDVAIFKFGRCFSHGAILIGATEVIHSYLGQGVVEADRHQEPLAGREVKFFSMWA
jgi:NlpC/P60 family putative phage cell wall peptidase